MVWYAQIPWSLGSVTALVAIYWLAKRLLSENGTDGLKYLLSFLSWTAISFAFGGLAIALDVMTKP